MKRKTLLVLSLIICLLLAACGGNNAANNGKANVSASGNAGAESDNKAAKQVTLKFMMSKQEAKAAWDKIIAKFEKANPNIKIQMEMSQDYGAALKAKIAAKNIPDVFTPNIDGQECNSGLCLDLTGQPFLHNLNQQSVEVQRAVIKDGKTYSMPVDGSAIGLIYNRKVLNDNGITTIPTTLSALKTVCETLKNKNISCFANGYKDIWTMNLAAISAYSPAVYGKYPTWNDDRRAGKVKFATTPEWLQSFDIVKDYIIKYGNKKTALDTDYNGAVKMIANAEAAFMPQGLWAVQPVRDVNPDADLGMAALPVSENPSDAKIHLFPDYALSIHSKTKYPDQALTFLDFLTSKEIGEMWSTEARLFSAVNGVVVEFDQVAKDINKYIADGMTVPIGDRYWVLGFNEEFPIQLQKYVFGKQDAGKTMANLDKYWDELQAKNQ